MLSLVRCWLYWNSRAYGRQLMALSCRISAPSETFGSILKKKKKNAIFNSEQEKESIIRVRRGVKFVPRDHRLSSLGKPRDAKR